MSEKLEKNSSAAELTPEQEAIKVAEYRRLEAAAGTEARALINERIDPNLKQVGRWAAMVNLMHQLMDEDSQRYRFVYEKIAQIMSFEKVTAEQVELENKYGIKVSSSHTVH